MYAQNAPVVLHQIRQRRPQILRRRRAPRVLQRERGDDPRTVVAHVHVEVRYWLVLFSNRCRGRSCDGEWPWIDDVDDRAVVSGRAPDRRRERLARERPQRDVLPPLHVPRRPVVQQTVPEHVLARVGDLDRDPELVPGAADEDADLELEVELRRRRVRRLRVVPCGVERCQKRS